MEGIKNKSNSELTQIQKQLAEEFEVNRNTLLRTYSILQDAGIIDNKRGIGFFVSENAIELIRASEKKDFYRNELPTFIRKVKILNLTESDLTELLTAIKANTNHEKI